MDIHMTPDCLKAIRKSLGVTQQDMADMLGMSRHSVNRMECGKLPITKLTSLAVRYLGKSD